MTPGNGRISGLIDGNAFSAENGNDVTVQRYLSGALGTYAGRGKPARVADRQPTCRVGTWGSRGD
ncbi:hypothetical protein [uncultured Sulfitobacter sp.]|uniref:hypothetical protein n=1 Tax=uncultured Sulfitobacter sp. TaxID=191468 RepID=UPI0026383C79|nr:hypothetical protein [uncultured Sulfitobacter sp.]